MKAVILCLLAAAALSGCGSSEYYNDPARYKRTVIDGVQCIQDTYNNEIVSCEWEGRR